MISSIKLRRQQSEANIASDKHFPEYKDQLAVLPTGSGKSILMVHRVEEHLKKHGGAAVILSPIVKVNDQLLKTFRNISDLKTEYLSQTKHIFSYADVYIGTVQSTLSDEYQRMSKGLIKGNVSILILDEAHIGTQWYDPILELVPDDCLVLRLTATPYKENKWGFPDSKLVYSCSMREMIDDGHLVEPDLIQVAFPSSDPVDICKHITKIYLAKEKGNKAVVYWRDIEQAKAAKVIMESAGIKAGYIASSGLSDETIDQTMKDFTEGDLEILNNVNMLSTGWDFPALSVGFMPFPIKSVNWWIQRIGRIARAYPNKTSARMYVVGDAPSIEQGIFTRYKDQALDEKAARPEGVFKELLDLEAFEKKDTAKIEYTASICDAIKSLQDKSVDGISELLTFKKFPEKFLKDIGWLAERFEAEARAPIENPIDPITVAYLKSQGFEPDHVSTLNQREGDQLQRVVENYNNNRHGLFTMKEGKFTGAHVSSLPPLYMKQLYKLNPKLWKKVKGLRDVHKEKQKIYANRQKAIAKTKRDTTST